MNADDAFVARPGPQSDHLIADNLIGAGGSRTGCVFAWRARAGGSRSSS